MFCFQLFWFAQILVSLIPHVKIAGNPVLRNECMKHLKWRVNIGFISCKIHARWRDFCLKKCDCLLPARAWHNPTPNTTPPGWGTPRNSMGGVRVRDLLWEERFGGNHPSHGNFVGWIPPKKESWVQAIDFRQMPILEGTVWEYLLL